MHVGRRHGGQPRNDGADRPIILHGGHIVVDLIRGHLAFFINGKLNVGKSDSRLRGPLHIVGAHPLHANGLAHGL